MTASPASSGAGPTVGGEPANGGAKASAGNAPSDAGGNGEAFGGVPGVDSSDGGSAGAPSPHEDGGAPTAVAGAGGAGAEQPQSGGAGAGGEPDWEGEAWQLIVSHAPMPTSAAEAVAVGFDLNADGVADNQFGRAMVDLTARGFTVNASIGKAIQNGLLLQLVQLRTTSGGHAAFSTFLGKDPQPAPCASAKDCGHHLDGHGEFSVVPDRLGTESSGVLEGSLFQGDGGDLPIRLILGLETADVFVHQAHVELNLEPASNGRHGRIGGTISAQEVDREIYRAVHATIVADVAKSCSLDVPPACGCAPNSKGSVFVAALDTDHDCVITKEEVKANPDIHAMFALDVDQDHDDVAEALSFAMSFDAVTASFTAP